MVIIVIIQLTIIAIITIHKTRVEKSRVVIIVIIQLTTIITTTIHKTRLEKSRDK